jgi:AdoMet-dependent heme synthase
MHVLSIPAIYALELTSVCNNHCLGCSNVYAADRAGPPVLTGSQWHELMAPFLSEAVQVRLTGGEPTLHPDFLSILADATSYNAQVTAFTNGRWREPEVLVRGVREWRNFSGFLISLHGADAASHEAFSGVPGSFKDTLANIRLAIENGVTVGLSTIITRQSWDQVEAVVELGRRLGVQHVAFNRYIGKAFPQIEPSREQMSTAVARIKALIAAGEPVKFGIGVPQCFALNDSEGCLAGVAYASIDPWGNLRPCAHSPTVVGSLREHSLADLWHSPAMNAWRALMPGECTTCAAYSACHGGCRAVQELRPEARDPLRQFPLNEFMPAPQIRELPADARPLARVRLRAEPFGYALLGEGQVVPIHTDARPVIEACNGSVTFAELAAQFGQGGLDLLGDLWDLGMIEPT